MPVGPTDHEPFEEIDAGEPAVRIHVRTGKASPIVPASVALIAGFLLLALLKPWSGPGVQAIAASAAPSRGASIAVVPSPTAVVNREDAIASECHAPSGWRIVTSERWQGREVRIWWAVEPVSSQSAFDPAVPYLSVVSDSIHELGYCAPLFGNESPVSTEAVGVWRIDPATQTAEAVHPTRIAPAFDDAMVAIWAPPGSATVGEASWATGRYVFGVGGRWFGVDLRIIDRGNLSSAAPNAPPGGAGSAAP